MTVIDLPTQIRRTYIAPVTSPVLDVDSAWIIGPNNVTTGAAWTLTHVGTGWVGSFPTRADLQTWLARPVAEQIRTIRRDARAALARQSTAKAARHRAALILHVLDGHMLPHGTDQEPDAKCAGCGGYIVQTAAGHWTHVNACRCCFVLGGWERVDVTLYYKKGDDLRYITLGTDVPDWAGVCPDDYREHVMCLSPAPADCGQGLCPGEADVSGYCLDHQG